MNAIQIKDVSDTAFIVAVYRALETESSNPLFRDNLADKLAGERGKRIVEGLPRRAFKFGLWSVVIRTCIIDDLIQSVVAEGVDTVLNIGAGFDTRPYRMDLPKTLRWIEMDYPWVLELKKSLLTGEKPRCLLDQIPLDLESVSQRRIFFSVIGIRSKKILVLTEGVIPYLSEEDAASLAADLRTELAFRYWIVDYFSPETYRFRRMSANKKMMQYSSFRFEPEDYFGFFKNQGWRQKEIKYLAEEALRLKRPIPVPRFLKWWMGLKKPFMSQERRDSHLKHTAYVLFERE